MNRYPLYNVDTEQSLVGAAMLDNRVVAEVGDRVAPEDFTVAELRTAWGAMLNLTAKGQPCDIVTVSERLEANGQLEPGGLAMLAELARSTPSAANARAYADVVVDLAKRRRAMDALTNLGDRLYDRGDELAEILGEARGYIDALARDTGNEILAPAATLLPGIIDSIDRRFNGEEEPMGRSTGFKDLDGRLMGLCPGLHILGARPSMGKTAMLLNMVAADLAGVSLIHSAEMPAVRLMKRLMATVGNMPLASITNPKGMADEHWANITLAVSRLKDAPLYIDDKSGQSIAYIERRANELADKHGRLDFIGVDYLQKIHAMKDYGMRHDRAVGEVAESLSELGKTLGCPVLALSQLNRALEQRPNKRPIMSDLKESSVLEQEAETIGFLYRDEVYNPDNPDNKGLAEWVIAKNREGETGIVHLTSMLAYGRFMDLAPKPYQEMMSDNEYSSRSRPKT